MINKPNTLPSLAEARLSYFELKGRVVVGAKVGSDVAIAAVCIQICCDSFPIPIPIHSIAIHLLANPTWTHYVLEIVQLGHAYNGLAFYQLTNTGNKKKTLTMDDSSRCLHWKTQFEYC